MPTDCKSDYVISYDITDAKRLNKLARALEKIAIRIQYSVFFLPSVKRSDLYAIISMVESIIDEEADDVRIYTVRDAGLSIGQAIDLDDPLTF